MKAKIVRNQSFSCIDYVFKKSCSEFICSTHYTTPPSVSTIKNDFNRFFHLRSEIKNPCWHAALSLPKGERLDSDKWSDIVYHFMEEMGFSDLHQFVAVRHLSLIHI